MEDAALGEEASAQDHLPRDALREAERPQAAPARLAQRAGHAQARREGVHRRRARVLLDVGTNPISRGHVAEEPDAAGGERRGGLLDELLRLWRVVEHVVRRHQIEGPRGAHRRLARVHDGGVRQLRRLRERSTGQPHAIDASVRWLKAIGTVEHCEALTRDRERRVRHLEAHDLGEREPPRQRDDEVAAAAAEVGDRPAALEASDDRTELP